MGRAGIRRRKPKRVSPQAEAGDAGIIEDLEDQAAWSSYGQHIPRLGNAHRDAIWWNRGFRYFRGLAHLDQNPAFRSSYWWTAVLSGLALFVAAFAVVMVVSFVIRSFF